MQECAPTRIARNEIIFQRPSEGMSVQSGGTAREVSGISPKSWGKVIQLLPMIPRAASAAGGGSFTNSADESR